jgi:hypothetical protein
VPANDTLRPAAWTFGTFGAFWGTWAVAAVDVERRLRLSHGGLGLLLSASVAAGGVAAAAFGGLTHRMGTTRSLAAALALWGVCVLGVSVAPGTAAFSILFISAMVVAGTVDAAMNTVVGIGARGDPATMVRFHALFNAGALVGAGATGLLLYAGSSWRVSWAAVAVACFVLAAACRRAALPGSVPASRSAPDGGSATVTGDPDPGRFGWKAVRALHLRTVAGVFLATALVEGGIDTWGVLYLRTHLAAGALLGAGAYVIGQAIAVVVRWSSSRHIGRIGARAGIVTGAAVAAIGLGVEATASAPPLAGLGLVVAVVGAATTRVGAGRLAAVVGAFTAVGYLGWVAGPALVGWVADAEGLGAGLVLLAGVAATAATLLLATTVLPRAR